MQWFRHSKHNKNLIPQTTQTLAYKRATSRTARCVTQQCPTDAFVDITAKPLANGPAPKAPAALAQPIVTPLHQ
eukprot:3438829-Ditylum_brightwellii.AAC.1